MNVIDKKKKNGGLKTIARALKPDSAQRGFPARKEPVIVAHPDGMRPRSPQLAAGVARIITDKPIP